MLLWKKTVGIWLGIWGVTIFGFIYIGKMQWISREIRAVDQPFLSKEKIDQKRKERENNSV